MEYTVAEVCELAGNSAKDNKRKTVDVRDIMMGIVKDAELNEFTGGLNRRLLLPHCGVPPNIHERLLSKGQRKKAEEKRAQGNGND